MSSIDPLSIDKLVKPPPPTALIIFGASGDLTNRKLVPALINLAKDNYLPEIFYVIGVSRTKYTNEEFRKNLLESVKKFSRREIEDEVWNNFLQKTFYLSVDGTKPETFLELKKFLDSLQKKHNDSLNYLYYLSVAPQFFGPITDNLRICGLIEPADNKLRTTRIVVEKPFGSDGESAKLLNSVLRENFAESQIFRIDHYLGKETVQNILVFRFANGIFEPLWNSKYIDNIQITVSEDIGVGGRGDYFDANGITRDIVQNHLLQMLALTCIEPPISLSDPKSIRDEKVKVLRSIRRLTVEDVANVTTRGQYIRGVMNGEQSISYREEKGVKPNSTTETAVAMKLNIDNWRWSGVPIYIRVGKRFPQRLTEIAIMFKRAPEQIFAGRQVSDLDQNVLTIRVQPKEGISLTVNSKPPGPKLRVRKVEMDFSYSDSFDTPSPEAYERLLLDAMKGDATLFIRDDEIEHSWDLLEPIFKAWATPGAVPLEFYESGSWGPESFNKLLQRENRNWR